MTANVTLQEAVGRLRSRQEVPLFVGQVWDPALGQALRNSDPAAFFQGLTVRDLPMAACAVAGLHLWNDDFSGSHSLCQGIHTPTGSYWHQLCHRREGHLGEGLAANLGNARYWIRQTGAHPAYEIVKRTVLTAVDGAAPTLQWAAEAADRIRTRRDWEPGLMVEWFADAEAGRLPLAVRELLQELQWREMDVLVDWCVLQAVSS